jgi:hypothetical protein
MSPSVGDQRNPLRLSSRRISSEGISGKKIWSRFVACVNFIQDLLHLLSIEGRGFAFSARKFLGFDLPSRIHGQNAFLGQPGEEHSDCGHMLFYGAGEPGCCSTYAATVIGSTFRNYRLPRQLAAFKKRFRLLELPLPEIRP